MKLLKFECEPIYPVNPWQVVEEEFSPENNLLNETVFALSNGYVGIRGNFEEGLGDSPKRSINGIYLNGFYESVPIPHAEKGFGYAENTQTILNVTDTRIIELYLGDERFSLGSGTVIDYKRTLNMKEAFQKREVTWRSPQGKEARITVTRLVPFMHRHLLAFHYQVEPLNFSGRITLFSSMDGKVDNNTHEEYDPRFSATLGDLCLKVDNIEAADSRIAMLQRTNRSDLTMACAMENHLLDGVLYTADIEQDLKKASTRFKVEAKEKVPVCLVKYVSYYTSRDYPADELTDKALEMVDRARQIGFESLLEEQKNYCQKYWDSVGFSLKGDPVNEQAMRFNLFGLLQVSGNQGQTSIPAKGLTSEGYDGHYFWDTEIYILPYFTAVNPGEARRLLKYRYSILDHARKRARQLSHDKGALFPWRTIAGEEGSSYYPASTAQYHINAAIAYAICKYVEMTGDFSFILECGAEIVFETARLWADLGCYVPRKGNRFCFHEVTGPDEYTALVNNNCYTNLMAQWHLSYAYDMAQTLMQKHPENYRRISKKIGLRTEELQSWLLASEYMYIPFDEAMQIHPQDDGFLDKEVWNFSATPADNYPLLLHYHPLVIYRYQVCKQPDIILAHLLLSDRFSIDQKRRDYNYYEPITTHDSSLSPAIFSAVSSELGYHEDAYRFFSISARLDLYNLTRSTGYGIHAANMGGSWICLTQGFAGMRFKAGELSFSPYLPPELEGYSFRVRFKECFFEVSVSGKWVNYTLIEGEEASFSHRGEKVFLKKGESAGFELA